MKITRKHLKKLIVEVAASDAVNTILNWAEAGHRVTVAGKNIWAGLGNRSGMHSYADELIDEKWEKSSARFTKKVNALPPGTEVELKQFRNVNRDRGKWVTMETITIAGATNTKSGKSKKRISDKRANEIIKAITAIFEDDGEIAENARVREFRQEEDTEGALDFWYDQTMWRVDVFDPFHREKHWLVFPDTDTGDGEYARDLGAGLETNEAFFGTKGYF